VGLFLTIFDAHFEVRNLILRREGFASSVFNEVDEFSPIFVIANANNY